jgi:hypothetical protein
MEVQICIARKLTETNDEYTAHTDGNFKEKKKHTAGREFHQHAM